MFEMRYLPAEVRELFASDMRIVVDFLAEGNGYRSDRKVKHKAALIKMIRVLSGDKVKDGDVEKWLEVCQMKEEDEIKVCELFDQYERRGRTEGENRLAELMKKLIGSGRNDDLEKIAFDQSYREELYVAYHI